MVGKTCKQCRKPLDNPRTQYCGASCRYWFNSIKQEKEKHLSPAKKRNSGWFYMLTGNTQWDRKGQGKRSGGMVTGGMGAMIRWPTFELVEVTPENIANHFSGGGNPCLIPTTMQLGNSMRLGREEGLDLCKPFLPFQT